jgi:DNA-binding transcriptional regulator YiaG
MTIQQHPHYHEGFYDAADFAPLYEDHTDEYKAGWRAYWACRNILEGTMTPEEVRSIRKKIASAIGQDVSLRDLGIALRLSPNNAHDAVRSWEDGSKPISGPAATALDLIVRCIDRGDVAYVAKIFGALPPGLQTQVRT